MFSKLTEKEVSVMFDKYFNSSVGLADCCETNEANENELGETTRFCVTFSYNVIFKKRDRKINTAQGIYKLLKQVTEANVENLMIETEDSAGYKIQVPSLDYCRREHDDLDPRKVKAEGCIVLYTIEDFFDVETLIEANLATAEDEREFLKARFTEIRKGIIASSEKITKLVWGE